MGELLDFSNAQHKINQAKIDAARTTQASGNEKSAAQSELARFSQSLGNRRAMDAAGEQVTATSENIARSLDAASRGRLGQRVAAAEELGASISDAAAAGMGGSTIEAYNQTLRMAQDMSEEEGNRQVRSQSILASRQQGDTIQNAVAGVGNDTFSANLNLTQYMDDKKLSTFDRLTGLGLAAAATYFGGPRAGMAVGNLYTAKNQQDNADFAGAQRSMDQAASNGAAGWRTYTSNTDADHPHGTPWGLSMLKQIGARYHLGN